MSGQHVTMDDPFDRRLFVQLADKTVANTAVETSALGTGIGSRMIAGDSLKVGDRILIRGRGMFSTPLGGASIVIRVKMNSVVVAQVTTSSQALIVTNQAFSFECQLVVRAIGAAGKVVAGGEASYTIVAGNKTFDDLDNAGTEVTIDTTAAQVLDVTLQWDTANAGKTIRTVFATMMRA